LTAYVSIVTWATDAVGRCLLQCITVCPLVISSKIKTKPCNSLVQFSSVQLRRFVHAFGVTVITVLSEKKLATQNRSEKLKLHCKS